MIAHHSYKQMCVSAFQEAKHGESCCGDSYFVTETEDYFICVLADGLGSGPEAKRASERAVSVVEAHHDESVETLMQRCNSILSSERGAVLSLFKVFYRTQKVVFAGVGNIHFILYMPNGEMFYPLPTVGYLSGRPQSYRVQAFPYEAGASFIIHSDGFTLDTATRQPLLRKGSPGRASRYVQRLLEETKTLKDDVTFIFGASVEKNEV